MKPSETPTTTKKTTPRSIIAMAAMIGGLVLVLSGVRIGTDPEATMQSAIVASALTPAGVILLARSHRAMRTDAAAATSLEEERAPSKDG